VNPHNADFKVVEKIKAVLDSVFKVIIDELISPADKRGV